MIGRKLGNRYEIQELIGEGATAIVYKGMDTLLQRTVAVKVLLPYVDETARKRFQREARAAAQLNHPNIMAIYDVGEDEQPYLVIEYIEGRPLFEFIPAPPDQVAEIGRQICEALDYAHRRHLIHRDIKPANIHITPEGQVKIMDFGLAITRSSKRVTATGRVIGTPAYLSPEQAQGQPLTHHTDIYSTGIVLYEMATGVLPFDADDIGILLLQQVKKQPKPPRELAPEIPQELERIILKALEKRPAARFQTAGEMAQALAALSGGRPVTPSPTPSAPFVTPFAPTQTQAPVSSTLRVVMADDHRVLRRSLAMFLTAEGIEVVGEADDGAQALALVQEHRPDVLLLDLDMPGTSGLDVLPQVRQSAPEVKVLVLTGQTEDSYIMRALRAGAHGYVLKTTEETELVQAVRDVVKGHLVLGHGVAERVAQRYVARQAEEPSYSELERAVLVGMAAGLSNDQIAERLHLAPPIVDRQVKELLERLSASSRIEAAMVALRRGVISLDDVHGFLA